MASARLTDRQAALMDELGTVVQQCRNVIEAHERRSSTLPWPTLNELQEIAVLRIALDDLSQVQATGRAEAS